MSLRCSVNDSEFSHRMFVWYAYTIATFVRQSNFQGLVRNVRVDTELLMHMPHALETKGREPKSSGDNDMDLGTVMLG